MRFDWLASFVRVVASGQISSAATELHLSQSALSRQMSALESDVGVLLLVREPRGVSLTPAGELLHRRAIELLSHVDELRELLEAESRDNTLVRIGIPPGAPRDWLLEHVLAGPSEVILNERTTNEQLDLLRTGGVDIALTHERSSSMPSRLVLTQAYGVALPPGSSLLERIEPDGTLDVSDLDGMRLLAHASSAVRSSEGALYSMAAAASANVDWVFRRFGQYPDLIAISAKVDGVVTTESHGFPESAAWTWHALSSREHGSTAVTVQTWANWNTDANRAVVQFVESLPRPRHSAG